MILGVRFDVGFNKLEETGSQQVLTVLRIPYFGDKFGKGCQVKIPAGFLIYILDNGLLINSIFTAELRQDIIGHIAI